MFSTFENNNNTHKHSQMYKCANDNDHFKILNKMKYPVKFCEMYEKGRRSRKKTQTHTEQIGTLLSKMYVTNVFERERARSSVFVCIKLRL